MVEVVRGDCLIGEAFLEILLGLVLAIAVKVVNVLDRDFFTVGMHLHLEALAKTTPVILHLTLGYKQVIDLFFVDLHVLHLDRNLHAII